MIKAACTSLRSRSLLALGFVAALLVVSPSGAASGATLSSSKAKRAVISYVKSRWGSSYAVHPACYKTSSRKSRCFVHMIHDSKACTRYATVTLKGRRAVVSMSRPAC